MCEFLANGLSGGFITSTMWNPVLFSSTVSLLFLPPMIACCLGLVRGGRRSVRSTQSRVALFVSGLVDDWAGLGFGAEFRLALCGRAVLACYGPMGWSVRARGWGGLGLGWGSEV